MTPVPKPKTPLLFNSQTCDRCSAPLTIAITGRMLHRFWSKVTINDQTECWEWHGTLYRDGYGMFFVSRKAKQQQVRAHRFVYELLVGRIPDELCVCHHCDNRKCVNPAHLFVGTKQDNTSDCIDKNRFPRGEKIGTSKLTASAVKEIAELAGQTTGEKVAEHYGITFQHVYAIWRGKLWKHLNIISSGRKMPPNDRRGEKAGGAKLTKDEALTIKHAMENGENRKTIAQKYHVHEATVKRIATGKTWGNLLG